MKKILILLILLLLSFSFFLILHDKGNKLIKPYLATYLESKFDDKIDIEVEHLKIDTNYVELIAKLNKATNVDAKGDYSLFSQSLDIGYIVDSNDFNIDINGTATGHFNNMEIKGEGNALKSKLSYSLNVKDDLLNNINANIVKADISEILLLTAQPAYAKGKVNVNINIPSFEGNQTKGTANIVLHQTQLNEKVINKKFKIKLPSKTILTGKINADVNQDNLEFHSEITSNLSTVKLNKATYNLKKKVFSANYTLNVPKLSKLKFLTQTKLYGNLQATGDMKFKNKIFELNAQSKNLGGEINLALMGNTLNININNSKIEKLLYLFGQEPYAKGNLLGDVKISSLKNLKGTFNLKSSHAKTSHKALFKKDFNFQLTSTGDIQSNIANIQTQFDSELFNLTSNDMQYKLKDSTLTSTYKLNVPDLSKLETLAGKPLQGTIQIDGELLVNKTLLLTGKSSNLDGEINFNLENQNLTSTIQNVSMEKLMKMLKYPKIFKGQLVGNFSYDLTQQKGLFTSNINQAQLLSNQLTKLIQKIQGVDLTKERYNETTFVAKLNKDTINFDFIAKSQKVSIDIPNAHLNKRSNILDARYTVIVDKKDVSGKIQGNVSSPSVSLDSSDYLKDKVIKTLDKYIDTDKLKDLGIGEKEKDAIKSIFGDLFK